MPDAGRVAATSGTPSTRPAERSRSRVHGPRPLRRRTASTPIRRGGSAGRRGDFITSPEVGPLFGAVLARYLDAVWDAARPAGPPSPSSTPAPGRARSPASILAAAPGVRAGAALRGGRGVRRAAGSPSRRRRVACGHARRADRRRRARQRAARQPAVPPRRARRRLARGVRGDGAATARSPRCCRRRSTRSRTCCRRGRRTARGPRCRTPPPTGCSRPRSHRAARRRAWSIDYARPDTAELAALPWRVVAAHVPRPRAWRAPLADPGEQDITADVRARPAAASRTPCARQAAVPAARTASTSSSPRAAPRGRRRRPRPDLAAMRDAQPGRRGGGAARPGRPRRVHRAGVDDCRATALSGRRR